jgi:hypothetical protein
MQTQRRGRGKAPLIFNLGARWVGGGEGHTLAALPLGKSPCTLTGPQGRSGLVERRENLLPPPGFEPRTVQPVAAAGVVSYSKNCLLGCKRRI